MNVLFRHKSLVLLLLSTFLCTEAWTAANATRHPGPFVPSCARIHLSADYLGSVEPAEGPGFRFTLQNDTDKPIKLAEPVPSSAHWYARVGEKWLWRASTGAGGSLVDAINEKGKLFAYQPKNAPQNPKYMTIPAHGSHEWTESEQANPTLAYRPGCAICNYPGERQYRVVFAYAYVPAPGETEPGLLACGIRSNEVDMPPLR